MPVCSEKGKQLWRPTQRWVKGSRMEGPSGNEKPGQVTGPG